MADRLIFLVEEPSMEAFLQPLLARLLPAGCAFEVHAFQGKHDLLRKLPARLRGYRHWLPIEWRLVVLVDRDDDDCRELKTKLDQIATGAELLSRTHAGDRPWQVVNRLVIEELEAWYFGDWEAVRRAYPRVSRTVTRQRRYRDPDAIRGGTWEAFERVLQHHGYFTTGLRKVEAARAVGAHFDPDRSRSHSFEKLRGLIAEATPYAEPQEGPSWPSTGCWPRG